MHALVLLLFAALPPDAPPVMPPDAPPVELAEHTGEPEHATLGCQCGETCDCVDCQCLDCPHRVDDTTERKQVVRLTLGSQPWCPHCPAAKRAAAASGVAVEIVEGAAAEELARRSGAASYPFWVAFDGDRVTHVWTGASNPAGVRQMALVEPARVTHDAQRHDAAKPAQAPIRYERGIPLAPGETLVAIDGVPVSQAEYTTPVPRQSSPGPGHHSHLCDSCGTIWSHDGTGNHYLEHSCPNCGQYQDVIHQGQPAGRLLRGGCANGNCGR